MPRADALKQEIATMSGLENLTNLLEQVAARNISHIRAQIVDSRPFFTEFWRIYGILKQLAPPPPQTIDRDLVVVIGLDWGMPGSLLNRVMDRARKEYESRSADVVLVGRMLHTRFGYSSNREAHLFAAPKLTTLSDIEPIYALVATYARVTFVYPRYDTLATQSVAVERYTTHEDHNPQVTSASEGKETSNRADALSAGRFIVEPDVQAMANFMNTTIVGLSLYHYVHESTLAYSAAQMLAMRDAYDNAKDASRSVTARYHRARRATIDAKLRELYGTRMGGGL